VHFYLKFINAQFYKRCTSALLEMHSCTFNKNKKCALLSFLEMHTNFLRSASFSLFRNILLPFQKVHFCLFEFLRIYKVLQIGANTAEDKKFTKIFACGGQLLYYIQLPWKMCDQRTIEKFMLNCWKSAPNIQLKIKNSQKLVNIHYYNHKCR